MANIKISELNELTTKEYTDYIPIVDTSADETKKISVENLIPSNVNLIAVSDTAPATYETGDKYFNTETNKIYTATSSGWANAEDAIENILYIVLEEQKSYTYDGETLVSVGGGSGSSDIVMVQEEPTEDTKLYVEETDLDFQGDIVNDIYSTDEIKTNKIWIDGKPIYRKVLSFALSSTVGSYQYEAHGISNIGTVIKAEMFIIRNSIAYQTPNDLILETNVSDTNFAYYNNSSVMAGQQTYVILEYTKGGNS